MTRLWLIATALSLPALASGADPSSRQAVQSPRIEGVGGTGVQVGYSGLVGPDRGVNVVTTEARLSLNALHLRAAVPFASYATERGQDTGLGNAQLSAWVDLPYSLGDTIEHSMGLRAHLNVSDPVFAWQNDATELWPGTGLELLWQGRITAGASRIVVQGTLGAHNSTAVAPFPDRWFRAGVSVAWDRDLGSRFGLTTTLDLQTWDTSPIELSAAARADLTDSLRLRAGTLIPLATWMGATPADRPAGVRELTLFASLGLML